jgi:CAAX protease family protein
VPTARSHRRGHYHTPVRLPRSILLLALLLPTAAALVYFVAADPDDALFRITYATAKVVQFALPVVALLVFDRARLKAIAFSTRGLAGGVALGLVAAAAILGLYFFSLRNGPLLAGLADAVRAKVAGLGLNSPAGFLALAAFLVVAHSFLEEYYWRWFVHARLRDRLPQSAATLVSSLAFAAHHVVVLHVYFPGRFWTATIPFALGVAAGGALWAWWYDRTGSLAGPWAAHALADVALMAVGFDLLYQ